MAIRHYLGIAKKAEFRDEVLARKREQALMRLGVGEPILCWLHSLVAASRSRSIWQEKSENWLRITGATEGSAREEPRSENWRGARRLTRALETRV
jgi:hypothetical protein